MYICVKLSLRDLNFGPYPPHSTKIYICRLTTALRVHGGEFLSTLKARRMMFTVLTSDLRLRHKTLPWSFSIPLHKSARKILIWPSTRHYALVKVLAKSSTRYTLHQGCSNLVAVNTIRIKFLRSTSSKKNQLHRIAHALSHAVQSFGEVDPRGSYAPRVAWLPADVITTTAAVANVTCLRQLHQLLTSSRLCHPLTCCVSRHWLWPSLTVDFFARVDFLQSRCFLPSFSRRFHFCSPFLHILLLNEE